MADANILQLPVAPSLDGSEVVWVVQGGTDKRTTTSAIANTATGFVPTTLNINTPPLGGLAGGGPLTGDLTLTFEPSGLAAKTAMVVADAFAINDSVDDSPAKATFPNAMKALTGLTQLNVPNLTQDFLIINRAADGDTYKINVSSLALASGNVPAGGVTGEALVKLSGADYDYNWGSVGPAGGGTGISSYTIGDLIYASGTTTLSKLADVATGNALISGGVGVAPAWGKIGLTTHVSGVLPSANGGTGVNNGSSTITLGGSLTLSGAFAATFTLTGITSVTFPTSGTLATTAGASIPSIAQGDLLYGSASNVLSTLAKNTSATRYLSNTGTSNNPAWAQIDLTNGVTGILPLANGGTNANLTASDGGLVYSTASALAVLAGTATAGQIPRSGSSAAPSWSTATYPATAAAGTILAAATANTIAATATPTLGIAGSVLGTLSLTGNTSGTVLITPQAAAGTPTLTLPNASGTFAVSVATPLVLSATTGAISWSGTSGGVPYFASSTTAASSGALTQNGVVLGGGAGAAPTSTSAGTNGQVLMGNTSSAPTFQGLTTSITFIIDGGGSAITTGVKGDLTIPFAYTITEWTLLGDQSGSIVVDIWADTYANYPPTVADTITASAKPTISTATKGQSSTLTGWTTTQPAGNTLRFNVDSITTLTRVTLSLKVTRTSA